MRCHHQNRRRIALILGLGVSLLALGVASKAAAQAGQGESSEDLTEAIPQDGGDIVENVETGDVAKEAPPPPAEDSPAEEHATEARVQLSGYARQSFDLYYGELTRSGNGLERPLLWRDSFVSQSQLVLRASYLKGRAFEATVSGMLGYSLHVAREAPTYSQPVLVNLTRGEFDPQLREAYVGFFWPKVDLRIGQQRVAWGRSDFQSPNDVINARDLRNPFLSETELRYLPTPVLRSSINVGSFSLEAVVSPLFVPDRLDVYGSNWSPIGRNTPEALHYQEFVGATSLLVDASVEREFSRLWQQTERPLDNGKGAAAGARISGSLPGLDLSAYYHYGYDSTPYVKLSPEFTRYLNETVAEAQILHKTAFAPGDFEVFEPVLDLKEQNIEPISSRYVRRHHVGLDLAAVLGPIVLRVDAAYETRRVFYQVDLNSFASPALLAVAGLEYQTGSMDDVVLLEFLAQRVLKDLEEKRLLGYEQTSTALAGNLRWALGDSWGIDLRGVVGLMPETYVLQPALRYKPLDAFTVRLGALIVSGETRSFGWYYRENDTAFLQLRYAF